MKRRGKGILNSKILAAACIVVVILLLAACSAYDAVPWLWRMVRDADQQTVT